jgi:hypothetical protein
LKQYFSPRHVSEYNDPYDSMKKALVLSAEYYVICSLDAAQYTALVKTAHSNLSLFGDLCKRYQKEALVK